MYETEAKLFEGINAVIAEKYAKIKAGQSSTEEDVSDLDEKLPKGKQELDEKSRLDEHQEYNVVMNKDEFNSKISKLGLDPEKNGKDHLEALDKNGKMKAWWNGHTGVGYIHKSLCESKEDQMKALEIAIQTAVSRTKEHPDSSYHENIAFEVKKNGLDPFRSSTHQLLDQVVHNMTNGEFNCHGDYAQSCMGGNCVHKDNDSNEDESDSIQESFLEKKTEEYLKILTEKFGEGSEILKEAAAKLAKNDLDKETK